MLIGRDLLKTILSTASMEAVLLWGPRQTGKTTLLSQLNLNSKIFLDDLALRQRSQSDPALVIDSLRTPALIDEAQYAPNLFPEIKLRIDQLRLQTIHQSTKPETLYYLTGSNKGNLEKNVQETLAGRCSLYALHGLSVKEILTHETDLKTILFRGGFPDLYARREIPPINYLNDYIISFIERDIASSAGIQKISEFYTVLRLLAARTGQFINYSEISNAAGIEVNTVKSWVSVLEKNMIISLLNPFHSNLSKRITKLKKLFFIDTGLCSRLQGHLEAETLWNSPQAGSLFETLVFSEIVKTKSNFLKNWEIHSWRTKEKNEIDFIIKCHDSFIFIESKLGIHSAKPFGLDVEAEKVFKGTDYKKIVVTAGGEVTELGSNTRQIPIQQFGRFLLENF